MEEKIGSQTKQDAALAPQWYIVHVISGREKKIGEELSLRMKILDLEDRVLEVFVPLRDEIQMRGGEKRVVQKNLYPGYILVKMVMDERAWRGVRETPGITGFISAQDEVEKRTRPVPMDQEEYERIKRMVEEDSPASRLGFSVSDRVRIKAGPFRDFLGIVEEVMEERSKLRVQVSFLGREIPVEVDFLQVEEA